MPHPPLQPLPGFNWMLVSWGAPDELRTENCSYCLECLGDDELPLILANEAGWVAEFCEACQRRWWGMTIIDHDDDEDRGDGT